jgi:hypothetical protein
MENSMAVNELPWAERQRINQACVSREDREILIGILRVFASIALVAAIATFA